jgi:uncharacterized protein DUF5678
MNRLKQFMPENEWAIGTESSFGSESLWGCRQPEWGVHGFSQPLFSKDLIKALVDELSGKADENTRLQKRVDELARRLDKQEQLLKQFFDPSGLPAYGTFEQWLLSNEAVSDYRGKHVAFVAEKGVIAFADSLDELVESIGAVGHETNTTIGFVPTIAASVSKC